MVIMERMELAESTLKNREDQTELQLEQALAKLETVLSEKDDLVVHVRFIQAELDKARSAIAKKDTDTKDSQANNKRKIESLEELVEELHDRIRTQEAITARLEERCLEAESAWKVLRNDVGERDADLLRVRQKNDALARETDELSGLVVDLKKKLVMMNDKIVELQGNIRVFCRVRPILSEEKTRLGITDADMAAHLRFPDTNAVEISRQLFDFDRVFVPETNQSTIFDEVEPVIKSAIGGCRLCIFAYGQTGSGKTYTMEGEEGNRGVNFRAFQSIFRIALEDADYFRTQISVSMLEVYNEKIKDLFGVPATRSAALSKADFDYTDLEIRVGKHGVFVENLREIGVFTLQCDYIKLLG